MCGIIGIISYEKKNTIVQELLEGLMTLQHRGQDSAGIATEDVIIKKPGLVKYAFSDTNLENLNTQICIGHVRYKTNGVYNNIQPLHNILPRRVTMCHNGNIINTDEMKKLLKSKYNVIQNTNSDSEIILTIFSCRLYEIMVETKEELNQFHIGKVTEFLHENLVGSFSLVIIIEDYGLVAVRDKNGTRPLIWGENDNSAIISSESVTLKHLDYVIIRDVNPGETIILKKNSGEIYHHQYELSYLKPCLFEYIYFARPDSILDKLAIHKSRIAIGRLLGEKMKDTWNCDDIDIIVPVPDTSITFANGIQDVINKPLREGLIRNRYIDRTFIMENFKMIRTNIRRKLSGIESVFKNRNVLIVDDSIVRGNTSRHIIEIARNFGAKKIYFGSCAPIISNTNKYGINIPTKNELISYNRDESDIAEYLGVDYLIYNDLDKITQKLMEINSNFDGFETSMFL